MMIIESIMLIPNKTYHNRYILWYLYDGGGFTFQVKTPAAGKPLSLLSTH